MFQPYNIPHAYFILGVQTGVSVIRHLSIQACIQQYMSLCIYDLLLSVQAGVSAITYLST